ncbi:MAG: hypothetical protein ACM3SQ_15045 [Betaproteobacteria bacterium]
MRNVVAGIVAVLLLLVAASLATTLQALRRRRQRARDSERALGRRIVAEIPAGEDLVLFSEDAKRFYYGERSIDKDLIVAARVLINGAPIASCASPSHAARPKPRAPGNDPRAPEEAIDGIARDRWDVAIEMLTDTVVVECGSIRERVSQEIARAIFDAVKASVEGRPF